jgi:hypothetical protein
VNVPISALWEAFTRPDLWPRWNRCMHWVRNRSLVPNERLLWAFRPMRRWYPYVLPAGSGLRVPVAVRLRSDGGRERSKWIREKGKSPAFAGLS